MLLVGYSLGPWLQFYISDVAGKEDGRWKCEDKKRKKYAYVAPIANENENELGRTSA